MPAGKRIGAYLNNLSTWKDQQIPDGVIGIEVEEVDEDVYKRQAMRQVYLGKEAVCVAKLSARQELFCLEYIRDGNAAQAAIRAGYSPKQANSTGCLLYTSRCV